MGCLLRQEAGLMHRFYVDSVEDGFARLTEEDRKHALKVLRLKTGDHVEAVCGGQRLTAVLREDAVLEITGALPSTEPSLCITLFQGIPKADKMDWIVQKAVELGVSRIVPVQMSRCVARISEQDCEKKRCRWARIAREAGKQSGRCLVPEVSLPVDLRTVSETASELDACVVPWEEAVAPGPFGFARSMPDIHSLGILIGPEGGISPDEVKALAPQFRPVTLGPRILRTETAGLAAAAAFLALYGEME